VRDKQCKKTTKKTLLSESKCSKTSINVLKVYIIIDSNETFYFLQIVAGYQGEDFEVMETDDDSSIWSKSESLEDDKAVKKLSAQIAQVVGWSDVHLTNLDSPSKTVRQKKKD